MMFSVAALRVEKLTRELIQLKIKRVSLTEQSTCLGIERFDATFPAGHIFLGIKSYFPAEGAT